MRARLALAAGLTLLAIAIVLTLLGSPMSVARTNKPTGKPEEPIASINENARYCQPHELLPRGTSAIRIWLEAAAGPRVNVVVYSAGRPVTRGERGSDWIGGSVTVPVTPLARTVADATVCVSFAVRNETVVVQGTSPDLMWIEYMRPGTRSWASLAGDVVRHMGYARAAPGTWVLFLVIALIALVVGLASRLLIREMP